MTESWPGHSLIAVIADNSYEHYQDHAEQIRHRLNPGQMMFDSDVSSS